MPLIETISQCSAFFNYKQYSMHKIMIKVYITLKTDRIQQLVRNDR